MSIPEKNQDNLAETMEHIEAPTRVIRFGGEEVPTSFAAKSAKANEDKDGDDDTSMTSSSASLKQPLHSETPSIRMIYGLIRGEVPLLLMGFLLTCLSEGAGLVTPYFIGMAFDVLQDFFVGLGSNNMLTGDISENADEDLGKTTMQEINQLMGYALTVYIASCGFSFAGRSIMGAVGERLVTHLRMQVFKSVLGQEIGFYDEHKTGEIVSRLGSDTQLLQTTISTFAPEVLLNFTKTIITFIIMFFIHAKLTAASLGGILCLCVVSIPFGMKLASLSKLYQDVLGEAQGRSTEALGNIRTVQSFAAENKELNRYIEKIGNPNDPTTCSDKDTTYSVGVKKAILQVGVFTLIFGGCFGFLYCMQWFGFYLVAVANTLSLGGLTQFNTYCLTVAMAIGGVTTNFTQAISGLAAMGRVFYLLERKPKIKNFDGISDTENKSEEVGAQSSSKSLATETRKSIVPLTPMEGNIEFQNVMFSYPTRPDVLVLDSFSLKLKKNTTTAFVGSSGSGKSTVVSLIQRFYDINGGTITLDGVDITQLDLPWLRSQIGYVQQEPQLFGVSVRDNLTYGMSETDASKITQIELENACRDANAHEFISSWPDGYDTMVGEKGITLSGGQKQRIAIARAMLTDCRILLLDEATSALDAESEHEVQLAIESAMVGRTVVMVAHRLSTIQCADQIVVMDNRKIVSVGTHKELLEKCTRYQDLIKRQNTMAQGTSAQQMIDEE